MVTVWWVQHVFDNFQIANDQSFWISFIINIIRTSPMWFLVWWLIGRYNNERKIQEEYAFKSSIAMTLRSYSEMLNLEDSGEMDNRSSNQVMLLKTFENLFQKPTLEEKTKFIKSKDVNESIKQFVKIIENIKK